MGDNPCPTCDGERTTPMSDAEPCPTCLGTGTRPTVVALMERLERSVAAAKAARRQHLESEGQ